MTTGIRLSFIVTALALALVACGGPQEGSSKKADGDGDNAAPKAADPNAVYGPLEVGADWQSYTKVNTEPVESGDHGNRFVDTYVNDVGLEAYKDESAEMPVGSIVVKTSWERDGDKPSQTPGPIFVMEKRDAGFDDANSNWYYAIHWENPTETIAKKLGTDQIYFRSPSSRVNYCFGCHNDYDRQLGMVPEEQRAW